MNAEAYQRLIDTLALRYADQMYTHNGITYPVVFTPERPDDIDDLLTASPPSAFSDVDDFAFYDADHLAHLRGTRRTLTNNPTFVMDRYTDAGISAKIGRYFDMLATCDALDHELRRFALRGEGALLNRQRLHQTIAHQDILRRGDGRSTLIGVAVLVVFNKAGHYNFIVAQRSAQVAIGAGLVHVVPAFVLQPSKQNQAFYTAEWSLRHQVIREFGEELFGVPEYNGEDSPDYFYDAPPVAELRAMLNDGRATLRATGVAFNLLSTRPEITCLLVIRDPDWHTHHAQAEVHDERVDLHHIPLDTLDGIAPDIHLRMTPQGAVCMWEGIRLARTLIEV